MAQELINIGTVENDGLGDTVRTAFSKANLNFTELYGSLITSSITISSSEDLSGTLRSDRIYVIDGSIDMGDTPIVIPADGLVLFGVDPQVSKLTSSAPGYSMFQSPAGGAGGLILIGLQLSVTGLGSQVYGFTPKDTFQSVSATNVNFDDCVSLGTLTNCRQYLETSTRRFRGTPELTFAGTCGGARISISIARFLSNITSLFRAGTGLTFSSRFITDMNCDLPASGAFIDFAPSNFASNKLLALTGCQVTRSGVTAANDTTIYPNISEAADESIWRDNVGLPNTFEYMWASVTTQAATTITTAGTYEVAAGTYTLAQGVHFDMPANGEFRLTAGSNTFQFTIDATAADGAGNLIGIRIMKSTDDGATWPTEIGQITREVNNSLAGTDRAIYSINFVGQLNEGDRVRIEVANESNTTAVTLEEDSVLLIKAL